MSRKSNRNVHAPVGMAPNPLEIDHAPGHKKSKRNLPRPDQSNNTYTEKPAPKDSSPKRRGGHASRRTSSDDDADGDVSNADVAEPDEESDEDGKGDVFAPSDRAMEHGHQAGLINEGVSDCESTLEVEKSHGSTAFKGKSKITKPRATLGDSDDDVYNRVDLISESEEDEPNIERLEERNIIKSEEADDFITASANLEATDGCDRFELGDGSFLEDIPFFDECYDCMDSNIFDNEREHLQPSSMFEGFPSPPPPSPSPRRVRFKEPISQLSNDSDIDSDNADISVLFKSIPVPTVSSGGNLELGGPSLEYEDEDGSSVGSSGYESGLLDLSPLRS